MLNRLVLAVSIIFCGGCAAFGYPGPLTAQGLGVQVADENIVRQCQYLGDVTGSAGTTEYARTDARNRAATMGATNIVFVSETTSRAMARAYRCPDPVAAPPRQ